MLKMKTIQWNVYILEKSYTFKKSASSYDLRIHIQWTHIDRSRFDGIHSPRDVLSAATISSQIPIRFACEHHQWIKHLMTSQQYQKCLDLFGAGTKQPCNRRGERSHEHDRKWVENGRECVCVSKCGSVQFNKTCKQRQNWNRSTRN